MAIVVFDASFLIPVFDPQVMGTEADPRLEHLLTTLEKRRDVIIVPTPALSEALIGAGEAGPQYLDILGRTSRLRIAPFGQRAAIEAAARHREALGRGDKKEGTDSWAKVKFDRQIVAIAKVEGAESIYSTDADIRRLCEGEGLKVIGFEELEPLPEKTLDLFGVAGMGGLDDGELGSEK